MTARRLAIYLPAVVLVSTLLLNSTGLVGDLALDMVFLACMALTGGRILAGTALSWRIWGALLIAGVAALVALRLEFAGLRYMPYAILAPANLVLAYVFAQGLIGDRVPILIRLIDIMGQKDAEDPVFRRFIERQCLLWCIAMFLTAAMALACMISAGVREVVMPVLTVFLAAQIAHFALSHHYAAIRYGRPETWMDTLKAMARPETWRGLAA